MKKIFAKFPRNLYKKTDISKLFLRIVLSIFLCGCAVNLSVFDRENNTQIPKDFVLLTNSLPTSYERCSAGIITMQWIITAKHCITQTIPLRAINVYGEERKFIKIIYQDYSDIAYIKLDKPFLRGKPLTIAKNSPIVGEMLKSNGACTYYLFNIARYTIFYATRRIYDGKTVQTYFYTVSLSPRDRMCGGDSGSIAKNYNGEAVGIYSAVFNEFPFLVIGNEELITPINYYFLRNLLFLDGANHNELP